MNKYQKILNKYVENSSRQLQNSVKYWDLKKPSFKIQIKRSALFIISLLITLLWPINYSNPINILIILASWILIGASKKTLPKIIPLTTIMLSMVYLFILTQILMGSPLFSLP